MMGMIHDDDENLILAKTSQKALLGAAVSGSIYGILSFVLDFVHHRGL
jgi:hypothetical protein